MGFNFKKNGEEGESMSFDAQTLIERIEEQARQIAELVAENENIGKERDEALKFDAANAELREQIAHLEHENGGLRAKLKASEDDHAQLMQSFKLLGEDYESRRAEFDNVIKQFKQFSDLPAMLSDLKKEIEEETKIRRENRIEKKKDRKQEIIENLGGAVLIAGFCFAFSFLGARYGMPKEIGIAADNSQRILFNQVYKYKNDGYDPQIKFFMGSTDADKVYKNQRIFEEQTAREAQEAQQAEEIGQ